jgi:unconventional prefoldin RPB5 interactor 1
VRRERALGDTLREYDNQYADLQRLVLSLPEKPTHEIMIPCTKFAMFEGELDGQADVFVGVGGDFLVERTAKQASEIIERRRDMLRVKLRDTERNVQAMESRIEVAAALRESGGVAASREEETVEDGRARIARHGDGSVEITEVYEADDTDIIASISTLAPSSENERVDATDARGDLDYFISRLEAMEMNEDGEPGVVTSGGYEDVESDDDSDVDVDGGQPPTIECPEDFVKYERWKAKRDAKDAELRAEAERIRRRAEEERVRIDEEIRRKHPPLKDTVIERTPGADGVSSSRGNINVDVTRKLSRYQMKKLGLEPEHSR